MPKNFKSDPFYCSISGDYALFSDPASKGGGEKFTYSVPTYQALKGIIENAYWKPSIYYVIDEIKIMKPIRSISKGILLPMGKGEQDRFINTYLVDVEYLVKFHFEWNVYRSDVEQDFNETKHTQILLRSLERGGRRDVFLGTRECIGDIARLRATDYEKSVSPYEGQQIELGMCFHSFSYPTEHETDNKLISNYARIQMIDGVIKFVRPEECSVHHVIDNYNIKPISSKIIKTAAEELNEQEYKEGEQS